MKYTVLICAFILLLSESLLCFLKMNLDHLVSKNNNTELELKVKLEVLGWSMRYSIYTGIVFLLCLTQIQPYSQPLICLIYCLNVIMISRSLSCIQILTIVFHFH